MMFSVIVPFFNEERYIARCIQSLVNQDFDNRAYEIIFIDNGSSDRSGEIAQYSRDVILLKEDKKGAYAARNTGLEKARGEIVVFVDADCVASKDWLKQAAAGFKETQADIILGKRIYGFSKTPFLKMLQDYDNTKIAYVLDNCAPKYFYGYANNMAVRREVFQRYGYFKRWQRAADTEFIQRCVASGSGFKISYWPDMEITHLEMDHLSAWVQKMFIRGQYNSCVGIMSGYRKLNYTQKRNIYIHCVEKNRYSFFQKFVSLFLLIAGDLAYRLGEIKKGDNKEPS